VDRIEEVSVPGPVNPTEAVGIVGAPEGPPMTLPPPPGFGGGSGGGLDGGIGKGSMFGAPGGMGGPKMVPGGFGGRSGATREKMALEGGGNTLSEAAVARGLKWLSLHQDIDGKWSMEGFANAGKCNCSDAGRKNDVAGTAFGLIPFLGAGETHKGGGNNQAYAKHVERGLKWLILKQGRDGGFPGRLYEHGLASIAICEAYGLTSDPVLKGPAQRAVDFIVAAQNQIGGWDYNKGGGTPDTSVSGWQVQALKSAQMGGLSVPRETMNRTMEYLNKWQGDTYGATYGYRSPGSRPNLNAVGLLARMYLGWGPRSPGLIKGIELLEQRPPSDRDRRMYYYYYATQVVHHMGGAAWEKWNPKMRDMLIAAQDQGNDPAKAHQKGSWSSVGWDVGGWGGGRLMMTSLSLLTLEVYYRFLPLYRREMGSSKDDAVRGGL
jgi:hypothetical protein